MDGREPSFPSHNTNYGSEDLTADLVLMPDGSYELQQKDGSTMKIARNRKWVKLPKKVKFIKE